jgi:hypothetical protein
MTDVFDIPPTTYIPVLHVCQHFEVRLMGWNGFNGRFRAYFDETHGGFVTAGSVCSSCAPQGRITQPHYDTLADAQRIADGRNLQ